jgi:hypothetical protein
MVGHALWLGECPRNSHEDDGRYSVAFPKLFCGGVLGLHTHLQQEMGITLVSYSIGYAHSATTQAIYKFGKMILRHE